VAVVSPPVLVEISVWGFCESPGEVLMVFGGESGPSKVLPC